MHGHGEAAHGVVTAPLSSAQRRLWFLERLRPHNIAYNIGLTYLLRGPLDVAALGRSIEVVVGRHEALRTSFIETNGEPLQVIARSLDTELPVLDLSPTAAVRRQAELRARVVAQHREPFDLGRAPLFRFHLLRSGDDDHVFAITVHHIVADGWSMHILLREIGAVYSGSAGGPPVELAEVSHQYRDYVDWQTAQRGQPRSEADLAYWRQRLQAIDAVDLPTDRPRPAVKTYRGETGEYPLPEPVIEAVQALGRTQRVTSFMIWLAALQVLLHRYTGQTDITVGTPVAGRHELEFEGTVGLFIDTLALRVDLSGNPSFLELLKRVRCSAIDAYQHQHVPFETLVEAINPQRVMNRSPFFDVLLNVRERETTIDLAGIKAVSLPLKRGTAKFDLTFSVHLQRSTLGIEYSSDLFEGATVARMAAHFANLLSAIVDDPSRAIGELEMLDEHERRVILVDWNAGERRQTVDRGVDRRFSRRAGESPDSLAAVFGDTSLTYRQLDERSSQLARYLLDRGAGGQRIAIYIDRCLELPLAVLGVLKAGAAYVPVDMRMPRGRLEFILSETKSPLVLTVAHLAPRLEGLSAGVVALDRDWPEIGAQPNTDPAVDGDSLMYVIYTSGSTGRPKGVEVEHRQALNYLDGITDAMALGSNWSYAMVQPLSVDSSVTCLFGALCTGGTLHLLNEDTALDPAALAGYFAAQPIDVLKIAPGHLAALHEDGRYRVMPRRLLILGGERCPADLAYPLAEAYPEVAIYNHYGPTETTVGVLTHRIRADGERLSPVPLGRPLANTRIFILDDYGNPVPVGVDGELCIQGDCLARGYLDRPELTAAAFIDNPVAEGRGGRLYRTGDRARYRGDGSVEFRGRRDTQVKIRGFRVELHEIERVLAAHDAVAQVAVTAARGLVALVVAAAPDCDPAELQRHAALHLPDYMVPQRIMVVDALPRMEHGKLDLKALDACARAGDDGGDTGATPPRSDTEKRLAETWKAVLQLDNVATTDSFFAIGGHSLLVVKLVTQIEQQWGVRLPVADVFQTPTLAELAARIDECTTRAPAPPPIKRQPRVGGGSTR